MAKKEEVLLVLSDLLRMDDVLACMLARRDLGGVVPEGIKVKDINFWNLAKQATGQIFGIIDRFYLYNVDRIYLEFSNYTLIVAPISKVYSIVVVISTLSNRGLIDVEIENTKRSINKLLESKDSN
jgi:hypothetical protein